ncbi:MAG: hypothetical protein D4Q79_00530 [Spirochaetia bacterium]|nr:MAG: hypothetical protein D4Q79_00530 [Spirochaetia bacterium]
MNKTTKIIIGIIITVLAVGGIWYGVSRKPAEKGAIKIGASLSLTGDMAPYSEEINKGIILAIEEAKQKGINVEYIAENDEFKPAEFVTVANKLLEVDKVNAVLTPWATAVKPTAAIFNQAKIPLLAVWDNTNYMKTAGKYIFTIGFSTEVNGRKMADYAFNTLKLKRVAVIHQSEEWSELISQSFIDKFQFLGGKIVYNEGVHLDVRDFRTPIAKTQYLNAEAIYFPLNPNANSIFLIQAKQLKFQGRLMTADGLTQDEINTAGLTSDGVYFTNVYTENTEELLRKYKSRYGFDSQIPAAVSMGYDGANVLLEAYKIASARNIPLRDALTTIKIQGTGSFIDMNGGQYSDRVEKIYRVNNGKAVEVK